MEQFNLDTWLINESCKVVTRDGREVDVYYSPTSRIPLIGRTSDNEIHQYTEDGFQNEMMNQAKNDLFFADDENTELTEFEKAVQSILNEPHFQDIEAVKQFSNKLLDLARKEIEEPASKDLEEEVSNWRHNHFHGRRDKDASGEYLERESQLDLARHFAEWGRKQMMKDAVDGQVVYQIGSAEIAPTDIRYKVVSDRVYIQNVKLGDKVKIIVIKEN